MSTRRTIAALFVGGALALAGCGGNNPTTPTGNGNLPNGNLPVTQPDYPSNPYPVMPTPTPAPMLQQVTATVASKTSYGGSWYCLGLCHQKVDAQIQLINPNSTQVSVTLTVNFTKSGQSVETQTQTVDLSPGQTSQVEVKATQPSDDVNATATLDNSSGSGGYPGSTTGGYPGSGGYPSTGGYPSSGGYPSTGGYPGTGGYTGVGGYSTGTSATGTTGTTTGAAPAGTTSGVPY